jgi:hypothetical protein
MANVVTTQIINDGPRFTVLRIVGVLDTSDVAPLVIANPTLLVGMDNTGALKAATFRVERCEYSIEDLLAVNLFWEATVSTQFAALTGRGELPCGEAYGGIPNNALPAGKTGSLLSTLGWAAGTLSFTLILTLVKVQSGVVNPIVGTAGPVVSQGYVDFAGTIPLRS